MMKVTDFKVGDIVVLNHTGHRMFHMPYGTAGVVLSVDYNYVRVDFGEVGYKYCLPEEIDIARPFCEPREVEWV